jgi:hypothetical protein
MRTGECPLVGGHWELRDIPQLPKCQAGLSYKEKKEKKKKRKRKRHARYRDAASPLLYLVYWTQTFAVKSDVAKIRSVSILVFGCGAPPLPSPPLAV